MDAFTGEIRAVGFNYVPLDWLPCLGQELQVQQYPALASILGNKFGGDGTTTFKLPNLTSLVIAQQGQTSPTGPNRAWATTYGENSVVLQPDQLPSHNHPASAALCDPLSENPTPGSNEFIGHSTTSKALTYATDGPTRVPFHSMAIQAAGSGGAHENRQPFLVMNYIICANGLYPVKE